MFSEIRSFENGFLANDSNVILTFLCVGILYLIYLFVALAIYISILRDTISHNKWYCP